MQATCNNLCATLPHIAFVLIGRDSGMGSFGEQSIFEAIAGRVIFGCGKCYAIRNMANIAA